jgi:hypothetical protein
MTDLTRRAQGVLIQEVDGEVLALQTLADEVHQLNSTASEIWRLYEGGASVEEISTFLATTFEIDEATARADATSTIDRLRTLKLVV